MPIDKRSWGGRVDEEEKEQRKKIEQFKVFRRAVLFLLSIQRVIPIDVAY